MKKNGEKTQAKNLFVHGCEETKLEMAKKKYKLCYLNENEGEKLSRNYIKLYNDRQ